MICNFSLQLLQMKDQDNKVERWCCRLTGLATVIFGLIGAIFLQLLFSKNHLSVNCFAGLAVGFIL